MLYMVFTATVKSGKLTICINNIIDNYNNLCKETVSRQIECEQGEMTLKFLLAIYNVGCVNTWDALLGDASAVFPQLVIYQTVGGA